MNKQTAEKIYALYLDRAKVMIHSPYVDSFAKLWKDGDDIMISSSVWAETRLVELEFHVSLYKRIELEDTPA